MGNKKMILNSEISIEHLDFSKWKGVNIDGFTSEQCQNYNARRNSVILFIEDNLTVREISEQTGIDSSEIVRFVKRCLQIDEYGELWGFRALNPQTHIKIYERTEFPIENDNYSGAFELLLNTYPLLRDLILDLFKSKKPRYRACDIHQRMIRKCNEIGIKLNEYPFNVKTRARRSLERYLKQINKASRYGDDALSLESSSGYGEMNHPIIKRPYQRVQFDGHKIDLILTIKFTDPSGNEITVTIRRIWILAVMDVATSNIIGRPHLCLQPEYSSDDVLHCIRNAIVPQEPMKFTIPGLKYPDEGGVLSTCIPETQYVIWQELLFDRAKANMSHIVKDRLVRVLKCAVNAGPPGTPIRRPKIERFFGILEENGYHLIRSTTGSNAKDPRGKNASIIALKEEIAIEHLEELTEVFIARYNCTPHSGNANLSPLLAMKQKIQNQDMVPRVLPEEQRYDLELLTVQDTRSVNGDVKKGRRPFIYYEGVPYRNDLLAKNYNLVGTKLTLQINIEDISKLKAFLPNGNEIGYLRAAGKWGARKHSLRTRKEINKLVNNKMIYLTSSDDPLEKYDAFCASQKEKRYMNKIAEQQRIKRNQNKASNTEIVEIDDASADAIEERNVIDFEETSTKSESNETIEPPPELKHLFRTISF